MLVSLSGCEKIGQKALDSTPNPSIQQEHVAQIAYDDLRQGQLEELKKHFEPELKNYYDQNEKEMMKFVKLLPQENYKSKKIVAKKFENSTSSPSLYTVTYEYSYPKRLVQYDVSFDKAGGSTQIRDFNVNVYGGF